MKTLLIALLLSMPLIANAAGSPKYTTQDLELDSHSESNFHTMEDDIYHNTGRYLTHGTPTEQDAADLAQSTYARVAKKEHHYNPKLYKCVKFVDGPGYSPICVKEVRVR